jgi:hypothetical protein
MTLIIQKPTGAKLNLRKTWQPMDPDAAAYITAVETADTEPLEELTKIAIDNFVLGCKADGIWTAIKASCILAGARTLAGALVPLVGTAPTNVGPFVSGDYNRKTGLVGNGTSKYLNSNRNNNADPQNSQHLSVFASTGETGGTNKGYLAISGTVDGTSHIIAASSAAAFRSRSATPFSYTGAPINFIGINRASSASFVSRAGNLSVTNTVNSGTPINQTLMVFGRGTADYTAARLAFYSIGESLDLALLDARVTDLINAFAAAIP